MKRSAMMLALAGATMAGTAPVLADTVVKIGFAGPLTGPISHVGKDEQFGAQLALDDANAKGISLAGQKVKFELMSEDDQADPRTATTVAQRLVDAGVKGVIGHVTSGAAIPSRIYEQAGFRRSPRRPPAPSSPARATRPPIGSSPTTPSRAARWQSLPPACSRPSASR